MNKYIQYVQHFNEDIDTNTVINWINTVLTTYFIKNQENETEIQHILDYLCYPKTLQKINIAGLQYDKAVINADKWSKALSKKGRGIKEINTDIKTILDFNNGFRIVKLVGKSAYEKEGAMMGHCVASYFGRNVEVYSLRDEKNVAHATFEKDRQIKGRGNKSIHSKYVEYCVKFLEYTGMTVGDSEMLNLGYRKIKFAKYSKTKLFRDMYAHESQKEIEYVDNLKIYTNTDSYIDDKNFINVLDCDFDLYKTNKKFNYLYEINGKVLCK